MPSSRDFQALGLEEFLDLRVDRAKETDRSTTMSDDEREIESSPLCGAVTRDGISVRVEIYRFAGTNDPWSLEVIDQEYGSTVWSETFASDEDAYAEFFKTLETEGIKSFLKNSATRLH